MVKFETDSCPISFYHTSDMTNRGLNIYAVILSAEHGLVVTVGSDNELPRTAHFGYLVRNGYSQ